MALPVCAAPPATPQPSVVDALCLRCEAVIGGELARLSLAVQVAWWRGYYHVVRPHHALRLPLPAADPRAASGQPRRYRSRTPAMAAGITARR